MLGRRQKKRWASLELTTNEKYNDSIQAYAAGLAEAAVSQQTDYCQKLKNYIETNLAWMEQQIETGEGSEYWYQVRLALLQLKGLEDGYNGRVAFPTGTFSISPFGFLLFQLGGDLEDLESAFNKSGNLGSGSCSAFIKLLPGNRDLLVSHDTWNNYQSMLRILKKYNNQWMIVDYKLFIPGETTIQEGVFTVLEQIPGMVIADDKTKLLYEESYWASYNVPGLPQLVQKYGDWFTYEKNPRAQIFRRNHTLVRDLDSMIQLMRFNNFPKDPLSRCQGCDPPQNGENAISARSDLNPANGTYPFGALRQRPHGGTDMKVTSFEMAKLYSFVATSGPTWDDLPAFQWSSSPYHNLLHMGHPDLWRFSPIQVHWG
ncbi:hypothetical protein JD844_014960 [Phrynosoma platyrhinos]|uniref:Phospholipase B-like n=1 Tax=Phrynosoma platyrhinos TaxID=52577 RepID=A0ABQ7T6Z8_PHRPL|nr:hypothetical protein JD844_014960 [Phrynosoma platyrhinos]